VRSGWIPSLCQGFFLAGSQLDMFGGAASDAVSLRAPKATVRPAKRQDLDTEEMARYLEASGRYRVIRKLIPPQICQDPRPGFPNIGVLIDTETTGLSHRTDEVIEIGAVSFTFDDKGNFGDVIGVFGGLQKPSIPIPAAITKLTGITGEMVEGQAIDGYALRTLVEPADIVIAHNAGFDRPFCEKLSDVFVAKPWACSVSEIDWKGRGFEGTKLGYLIAQSGYFHDGHRAVDDCFALLEVLTRPSSGDELTPFAELYGASQRTRVRIWAENSPFDMKDKLKARGYRWSDGTDGRPKSWWVEVSDDTSETELQYLRTEIYHRADADPATIHLTAVDRFKA